MESPCTKVCALDPSGNICIGCRRTVDEIAAWGSLSDVQRARIMAELPKRRLPDAFGPDSPGNA
jgi:predicted Fe-S protein YdhL (DUF1289 family)